MANPFGQIFDAAKNAIHSDYAHAWANEDLGTMFDPTHNIHNLLAGRYKAHGFGLLDPSGNIRRVGSPIVDALQRAIAYGETGPNRIILMNSNLRKQGIPGQTAQALAEQFANNPDMTNQQTQFLAALQKLGYLSHQAR